MRRAIGDTGIAFTAEQRAAIHALGEGGALTLLTGVAGAGKTTLLQPLVAAWQADTRFSAGRPGGDWRRDGLAPGRRPAGRRHSAHLCPVAVAEA